MLSSSRKTLLRAAPSRWQPCPKAPWSRSTVLHCSTPSTVIKANRSQLIANEVSNELILLVDDEPSIVQLARMYLEREGFRTESVGDGEAALSSVMREGPALV